MHLRVKAWSEMSLGRNIGAGRRKGVSSRWGSSDFAGVN